MTNIDTAKTTETKQPPRRLIPVTVSLVALGDFLLFQHGGGAGLFVFAIAIATTTAAMGILGWTRETGIGLLIASLATLPILEAPSLLALLLAGLGLGILALGSAGLLPARAVAVPQSLLLYALATPGSLISDALKLRVSRVAGWKREVLVWTIPAFFVVAFAALFWSANAVFADVLGRISFGALFAEFNPIRGLFWLILAAIAWTALQPRLASLRTFGAEKSADVKESLLFGRGAIVRSLIVFNGLFLVETVLDLTYLWGRVQLPDGLTYADYAHRGAFPLIATALLSAAFVLVAMRPNGPAQESKPIRGLVYAWIAQNVLLCLSAMLRLDLYVEAYSLTELRLAAAIWMGLVAIGLILIVLRILLGRSNQWLVAMNLAVLTGTLYVAALADVPALVADFNVAHSRNLVDQSQWLDLPYLVSVGPTTIPAIDTFLAGQGGTPSERTAALQARRELITRFNGRDRDWRDWSFRDARLADYLASHVVSWAMRKAGVDTPAG